MLVRAAVVVRAALAVVLLGMASPALAEVAAAGNQGVNSSAQAWQRRSPEPPRPIVFAAAGLGYPELANGRAGLYVLPRLTLEAIYGLVRFNHMIGGGLTVYLFGASREEAPPLNSVTLSVYLRNNMFRELGRESVRDELGGSGELAVGYAYHGDNGALVRAEGVAMTVPDRHAAEVVPVFRLSAGWTFPFLD